MQKNISVTQQVIGCFLYGLGVGTLGTAVSTATLHSAFGVVYFFAEWPGIPWWPFAAACTIGLFGAAQTEASKSQNEKVATSGPGIAAVTIGILLGPVVLGFILFGCYPNWFEAGGMGWWYVIGTGVASAIVSFILAGIGAAITTGGK